MTELNDLTGKRFGNLVVIRRDESSDRTKWVCKCDCGNETSVFASNLINGHTKSCGCKWITGRKPKEIKEGTRIGKLTVLRSLGIRSITYGDNYSSTRQFFLVKCDCGNIKEISSSDLRVVRSCGCIKRGRKPKLISR